MCCAWWDRAWWNGLALAAAAARVSGGIGTCEQYCRAGVNALHNSYILNTV
jgi:hypothetical protein